MSAAGRVCTGFSLPYVAKYANSGTSVSYSNGQKLARGVSVTIEPNDTGDNNNFWADNALAETEKAKFSGATTTLTVDGLFATAEALIMGLPNADTSGGYSYNDSQAVPYVGIGFVARYMSDGVTSHVPIILWKNSFRQIGTSAATQTETIDWQTQELVADTMRSDMIDGDWKYIGAAQTSEAAAEAIIIDKLNISTT